MKYVNSITFLDGAKERLQAVMKDSDTFLALNSTNFCPGVGEAMEASIKQAVGNSFNKEKFFAGTAETITGTSRKSGILGEVVSGTHVRVKGDKAAISDKIFEHIGKKFTFDNNVQVAFLDDKPGKDKLVQKSLAKQAKKKNIEINYRFLRSWATEADAFDKEGKVRGNDLSEQPRTSHLTDAISNVWGQTRTIEAPQPATKSEKEKPKGLKKLIELFRKFRS